MRKYRYKLKKRIWNLSVSYNNYLKGIGFFFGLIVGFYIVCYYVFFLFIGNSSVDVVIGLSIFSLFFLIYKKGRRFIYNYVWSLTKNLYLHYRTLYTLLIRFKVLVYRYNRLYLHFFRYNFFVLKIVSNSMSIIYNKLSNLLLNKYLINLIYTKLNLKLYYVTLKTNNLPFEYILKNNCIFELNMFLAYDILFFLL